MQNTQMTLFLMYTSNVDGISHFIPLIVYLQKNITDFNFLHEKSDLTKKARKFCFVTTIVNEM